MSPGSRNEHKVAERRGWKPVTLHPITLVCVALVTSSLVAILSYLENLCSTQDGLAFTAEDQEFPALTTFGYQYLPTIISVIFSMTWAWVDLDMKRLEPFFQMSRPEGATADQSLLLQYPFDFIAWAPLKAARRRHWGVFTGGVVTVLIFWAITPLQGAIFDTQKISISGNITTFSSSSLNEVRRSKVDETLDSTFLEDAWNIIWHNASLPAMTTRQGALVPADFQKFTRYTSKASVIADMSFLSTTLDCSPINVTVASYGGSLSFRVEPGNGCQTVSGSLNDVGRTLLYFGYHDNPSSDWYLNGYGCPKATTSNSFLAMFADAPSQSADGNLQSNAVAQFCTASYWSQTVEASMRMPSLAVDSTKSTSPSTALQSNQLNVSVFESIIGNGFLSEIDSNTLFHLDAPAVSLISETATLSQYNASANSEFSTNMAGFILGASSTTPGNFTALMNPDVLALALEKTHQLLFAVAAHTMFARAISDDTSQPSVSGIMTENVSALVIVQPFAFIMQSLLAATTICSLVLAIYYWQRQSCLVGDPDSLRHVGKMTINADPAFVDAVMDLNLEARFKLGQSQCSNYIEVIGNVECQQLTNAKQVRILVRPFYLGRLVGCLFIFILTCIVSTLVTLQQLSEARHGLQVLWSSSVVQQIVLNYLPTLVATLLEPFWTLLSRMRCLLQPFEDLRLLKARGRVSIDSRYTSLPPQLVFYRALKNKHIMLAGACIIATSANILAVTMNALLYQSDTTAPASNALPYSKRLLFNNGTLPYTDMIGFTSIIPFQDHFYLANMNLSQNASLPPWTAKDHFLLPLSLDVNGSSSSGDSTYEIESVGFAVESDCFNLGQPSTTGSFRLWNLSKPQIANDGFAITSLNFSLQLDSSQTGTLDPPCFVSFTAAGYFNTSTSTSVIANFQNSSLACGQLFFAMYARNFNPLLLTAANGSTSVDDNLQDSPHVPQARQKPVFLPGGSQTFIACRSRLAASMYSSRVLASGLVMNSTRIASKPLANSTFFDSDTSLENFVVTTNAMNSELAFMDKVGYQAVTANPALISQQWFPYLMDLASTTNSSLDPSSPVPTADELIPLIQNVNARLGALLIYSQQDIFFPYTSDTKTTVIATQYIIVQRVFFDPIMFPITIALLVLNILFAAVFYTRAPCALLPEMPTTIYAQIKLFRGSSIASKSESDGSNARYGYGRFMGMDGKLRTGIERVPYVCKGTLDVESDRDPS